MDTLPTTQTRLLRSLLSGGDFHQPVPRSLHGAARGLHAHPAGHMVSLNHVGDGGKFIRARLTGRGRDLAAELGIEVPVHRTPEEHRREADERETALYISQWGRLPASWGNRRR